MHLVGFTIELDVRDGLVLLCSKKKLPEDGTAVPKTCSFLLVVNCVLLGAYVLDLLRCLGIANCCSSDFGAEFNDINFEECSMECVASSYKCRRQRSGKNGQWFCYFMSSEPVGHSHRAWGVPRRQVQVWTCGSVRDMLTTGAEYLRHS